MNNNFSPPNTGLPLSKSISLKRIPLSERTPVSSANDSSKNGGGVTVTPHTGQIQKPRFSSASNGLSQSPSDIAENNPEETNSNTVAHEYEAIDDNIELSEKEVSLDLPGITAHSSKISRTSKLIAKIHEGRIQDKERIKKTHKPKPKSTFRRLVAGGWIPNQHGAYMMILIPPIVGMILSGPDWRQILFLLLWIASYFTFFSFSRWSKSGRKERYFPPVKTYGIISALLVSLSIALMPPLLPWAIPFIPVVAISAFEAYNRRSESFLARSIAVISAGLSGLVSYDIGVNFWHPYQVPLWIGHEQTQIEPIWASNSAHTLAGWDWALMVMLYLTIYFWSTIPFVKTLARKKNSFSYYLFSVASHSAILVLMGVFAVFRWVPLSVLLVWFILSLRSIIIPLWNKHSQMPVTLKQVGMIELIICFIVVSAIFV